MYQGSVGRIMAEGLDVGRIMAEGWGVGRIMAEGWGYLYIRGNNLRHNVQTVGHFVYPTSSQTGTCICLLEVKFVGN
jgi:hypothetical protein